MEFFESLQYFYLLIELFLNVHHLLRLRISISLCFIHLPGGHASNPQSIILPPILVLTPIKPRHQILQPGFLPLRCPIFQTQQPPIAPVGPQQTATLSSSETLPRRPRNDWFQEDSRSEGLVLAFTAFLE